MAIWLVSQGAEAANLSDALRQEYAASGSLEQAYMQMLAKNPEQAQEVTEAALRLANELPASACQSRCRNQNTYRPQPNAEPPRLRNIVDRYMQRNERLEDPEKKPVPIAVEELQLYLGNDPVITGQARDDLIKKLKEEGTDKPVQIFLNQRTQSLALVENRAEAAVAREAGLTHLPVEFVFLDCGCGVGDNSFKQANQVDDVLQRYQQRSQQMEIPPEITQQHNAGQLPETYHMQARLDELRRMYQLEPHQGPLLPEKQPARILISQNGNNSVLADKAEVEAALQANQTQIPVRYEYLDCPKPADELAYPVSDLGDTPQVKPAEERYFESERLLRENPQAGFHLRAPTGELASLPRYPHARPVPQAEQRLKEGKLEALQVVMFQDQPALLAEGQEFVSPAQQQAMPQLPVNLYYVDHVPFLESQMRARCQSWLLQAASALRLNTVALREFIRRLQNNCSQASSATSGSTTCTGDLPIGTPGDEIGRGGVASPS